MECYLRCDKCPGDCNPVPGGGDLESKVVFVGEQPGKWENEQGKAFVGKTGKELDQTYLPLSGFLRQDVYVTNIVKCMTAESGKAPADELIRHCAATHLQKEILQIRPKVVVLMGGAACSLVPGYKQEKHFLEKYHGRPRLVELFGHRCFAFPTYHPALGIHQGSRMRDLLEDFRNLKEFLRGRIEVPKDEWEGVEDYRRIRTAREVRRLMTSCDPDLIAVDTESRWTPKGYDPWSAQFSLIPGTGYLIRTKDREPWQAFADLLPKFRRILMQNARADIGPLNRMGVPITWDRVTDTMFRAFYLGLPQGLKVMAYRLCGMEMRDFDDVTMPYGKERAIEYLMQAQTVDWGMPPAEPLGEMVQRNCKWCAGKGAHPIRKRSRIKVRCMRCLGTGKVMVEKVHQPQGMNQKLTRLVGDWLKDPEVDLFERWDNWDLQTIPVEEQMGPLPRPCISLVPEPEALHYACRDPDATLRAWQVMQRMGTELRRSVRCDQ